MLGKTKNFLFNLCKKKTILFVFFFSFFGLTFARSASAGWVENLATWIATRPFLLIIWLLVKFAIWNVGLVGSFLNWVLSPNFISLSYTNPANNPIIDTGLGVTQGFVNMLLVLILVYIAIATILRLAGYETKKLLVTFIIVALLVNFAPVICGIIVDASNIVMNFFIQDLKADAFGKVMGAKVEQILAGFDWKTTIEETQQRILQLVIMVGFLFVLSFILFLFTILFILRYLVIWLLVILSPLAFACYILPMTRKYFDKWWEQFISWSFIGVTCGFFLYLGLLLVTYVPTSITAPETGETPLFNNILPYFVSAIFLGIGFVFGLQTSAIGAKTVVNFAKGTQRAAGRGAKWVGGRIAQKGIRPIVERPARLAVDKVSRAVSRVGAWGYKGVKPLAPLKWLLPEKVREFGNIRPVIEKSIEKAKKESGTASAAKILTRTASGAEGAGLLIKNLITNDAQDLFTDARKIRRWKDMSDQEILEDKEFIKIIAPLLKHAEQAGMTGRTLRRDPRLAKIAAVAGIRGYKGLSPQKAVTKAVGEAREHIKDWEPESLKDPEVLMACLAQFDRDRWLQVNRQVKEGQNTAHKTMDKVLAEFKRKNNLTRKSDEEVWNNEFKKFINENYGGTKYFEAVTEDRMQRTGWRTAQTPTPGTTAMGSPPPPKERTKPITTTEAIKEKIKERKEPKEKTKPMTITEARKERKKKVQMPTMITRKMRAGLKKAGYSDEDIRKMTPIEAWEKLGRTF